MVLHGQMSTELFQLSNPSVFGLLPDQLARTEGSLTAFGIFLTPPIIDTTGQIMFPTHLSGTLLAGGGLPHYHQLEFSTIHPFGCCHCGSPSLAHHSFHALREPPDDSGLVKGVQSTYPFLDPFSLCNYYSI